MTMFRIAAAVMAACLAAPAQQPNTSTARMMIDFVDGPLYPSAVNVRTNTVSTITFQGFPNQPFALCASTTGQTAVGSAVFFTDSWDLPVPANPATYVNTHVPFDGFSKRPDVYNTTAIGTNTINVSIPPSGAVPGPNALPVGFQAAFQGVIADPSGALGHSLTAATQVTITQGPTTTFYSLGDDGSAIVNLSTAGFTIPFYGTAYTHLALYSNGYVHPTTGSIPADDFTPSSSEFVSRPPMVAGFWVDLTPTANTVLSATVDASPPGASPYVQVDWVNISDFGGAGFAHTFSVNLDADGVVKIISTFNNPPSIIDTLVGIGPGNNLNSTTNLTMKDLSALNGTGAIGGVNENFHEWFGIPGPGMPFYTFPTARPYDLTAVTLTFFPIGAGSLPASTNAYLLF